jgi:hypothetical protein
LNFSEHYAIAYKGAGIDITSANHSLDTTWAYFNIKLDSEVTKTSTSLQLEHNKIHLYIDKVESIE